MPEPAINDKRAQTDEAIRPTLGSEKLQVGERPVESYAANLQQDPSIMSAVFNPDIFNALGKISKDVHDTRRNSRYYDTLSSGQEMRENLADLEEVTLQARKLAADNSLNATKLQTLHKLSNNLEEAQRSANISSAEVLQTFQKEGWDLADRNYTLGNTYLAEQLGQWTTEVFQTSYPKAVAADRKKQEDIRTYTLNELTKSNAYFMLNNFPGYEDPKTVIERNTRTAIKTSNALSDPEDQKNNNANNQILWKTKADQIFGSDAPASVKAGALQDELVAATIQKEAVLDEHGKEVKDEKGNIKYTYTAPYVIETRQANETEQQLIEARLRNKVEAKGIDPDSLTAEERAIAYRQINKDILASTDGKAYLNMDKNGQWDGTITEKWSTGADIATIEYIKNLMGQLDWSKEAGEALHAADSYKKATRMDDMMKGNYLDNPYIFRGGSNTLADYQRLQEKLLPVYQHGTATQQDQAHSTLENARKYVVAPAMLMDQVRVMANNGYTTEQIIKYLRNMQTQVKSKLNENRSMQTLTAGDFEFLTLSDQYTGINYSLAPVASLMMPGDEPGFFNYAWMQNMDDVFGSLINTLGKSSGENIVQIFPYMNNAFQLVNNAADPSNLQSRNEDGTYSKSKQGILELRSAIQETAELGVGLRSEHATADKIVDGAYKGYQNCGTVETRENNAQAAAEASPAFFLSYIGSNTVTDSNKKKYLNSVGAYALFHPNGQNIPQHSEWERRIATSKQAGGAFANPNADLAKTLEREGFTADKPLSHFLQKVDPPYYGVVSQLYYDAYAADYAGRNELKHKRFVTGWLDDIISYNFRKDGSYKYPLSARARSNGTTSTPMTDEGYKNLQKRSQKVIKEHGLIKSGEVSMPDPVNGTRKIKIGGTPAQVFNGDKYNDLEVSTVVPPGMKVSNAQTYENEIGSLMLNTYAFTHADSYQNVSSSWKQQISNGRDFGLDQQHAMRILATMNNKDNQQLLKMIADGQVNPPLNTAKGDDAFYKWLATGNLAAFTQGPTGLTPRANALSPQEQRMVKMLKAADQLSTNKLQAQTYLYNTDIKVDPTRSSWTAGKSFSVPGNTRMTVNSPFGYRTDPFNKGKREFHFGVDVNFADGIVHNQHGGTVVHAGEIRGYGQSVIVKRGGLYFLYGHMASVSVHKGDHVLAGQALGVEGSTGHSTGKHCHYGVSRSMNFDTAHMADAVNPAFVYAPAGVSPQPGNAGAGSLKSITQNSLKKAGYTYTTQDYNYMNTWSKKTFDATDAALCGRHFGPASQSTNNLDPKNEQHRQRVKGMLFSQLNYGVFHDREKAAAALYPNMKFQYKLANGTVMKPVLTYADILKAYRNGNLRRWGQGTFVPVDPKLYTKAVGYYRKAAK